MEDFLPMLRMANVFPRRRRQSMGDTEHQFSGSQFAGGQGGGSETFGMPEIDSGNVGAMFRQTIPIVNSQRDREMQRQKDMMQFEFNLRNQQNRQQQPNQALGIGTGRSVQQAPQPQGGFSPMQRMFQERDAIDRKRKFEDEQAKQEIGGKYKQAIDERTLQEEGANLRNQRTVGGQLANTRLEGDMRAQLEQQKAIEARIVDKIKHGYKLDEDESRIFYESRGRIASEAAKPPSASLVDTPKEATDRIALNYQQFLVDQPGLAKAIQIDPQSGKIIGIDRSRLTDQQFQFIRQSLFGGQQPNQRPPAPPDRTGTPSRGRLMQGAVPPSGRSR